MRITKRQLIRIIREERQKISTQNQIRQIIEEVLDEDKSGKGKCPSTGCVKKSGNKWRIISNKTGKLWPQHYDLKKDAEDALEAYHASR